MSIFEHSWTRTWSGLGLQPDANLFEALMAAYAEPQRRYHSLQHLEECLGHFEQVRELAEHPEEVEIALWFHDAVYDVRGATNERQSADWAVRALMTGNASRSTQNRVEQLIMATRHDAAPGDSDERLLVDIDLSILGAAPKRFAEYDGQIRAEYSWVPEAIYVMKRKAVLSSFLARTSIYSTAYFRERYETQARINLSAAIHS
ncbi:HD domain-containing protein [Pseudomonas sp. CNPSo 3701]|uniref:HD domain-containing protein n=1 Tax=Pseudomonas sp. CNPSo 3701 TaxID=3027943 RepID=UPI0023631F54|nr:N-methyl-D-aspartate receptor NMDAR2C subunit [Pseudomonas sp. CNPSo 3701]MDD1508910.1 N-methyl-D-aspartate receptor NMDAR2C subunit [Pseudomonas sp. CNPSo 3701]